MIGKGLKDKINKIYGQWIQDKLTFRIYNKRDQFIQRCFCVVFNVTGGHWRKRSQRSWLHAVWVTERLLEGPFCPRYTKGRKVVSVDLCWWEIAMSEGYLLIVSFGFNRELVIWDLGDLFHPCSGLSNIWKKKGSFISQEVPGRKGQHGQMSPKSICKDDLPLQSR